MQIVAALKIPECLTMRHQKGEKRSTPREPRLAIRRLSRTLEGSGRVEARRGRAAANSPRLFQRDHAALEPMREPNYRFGKTT